MARIISLVNQKGGVGKTTTAVNLAAGIANLGRFVLLIDLDPQGNATSGLGLNPAEIDAGIYELISGDKTSEEVVQGTAMNRLGIIPATQALAGAAVELVNVENRELCLQQAIDELRHKFDYIIIDNPPSLGLLTINGLVSSDSVIIPVQAEYYALEGLGQLMHTVDLVQQNLNNDLRVLGAVLTMYDRRTRLSGQVFKEIERHFSERVFDTRIPRNVKISEAPSFGKTIFEHEPFSKGARAYKNLAKEVLALEK